MGVRIIAACALLAVVGSACAAQDVSSVRGPFGERVAPSVRLTQDASPTYAPPQLTVECWARLASKSSFNILVANEPKSSSGHWELYTYAGSGVLAAYMPGCSPAEVHGGPDVTDGRWHYLAMTRDAFRVRLYVDAKMVVDAAVQAQTGLSRVAGPLGIGQVPGTDLGCDGSIAEVRLSNTVRAIESVPRGPLRSDAETFGLWQFAAPFAATGVAALSDPLRAGAQAAFRARQDLGEQRASLALVFDSVDRTEAAKRKLLDGVGWFFDGAVVYGCEGFGPLTQKSASGTVGVLAIGEDVAVTSASAPIAGGHRECGVAIGKALKAAVDRSKAPGKLVVLLGDCHVPADDDVAAGVQSVLGSTVRVVGGSAPLKGFVYERGQVKSGICQGILLSGNFEVGCATLSGQGIDGIVEAARKACSQAVGTSASVTSLVLAFDCVSRKQALGASADLERAALTLAGVPLYGFYGSGEIGPTDDAQPSRGVGGSVAVCAIRLRR